MATKLKNNKIINNDYKLTFIDFFIIPCVSVVCLHIYLLIPAKGANVGGKLRTVVVTQVVELMLGP